MKTTAFILSFYIFALSTMQCADVIASDHPIQTEQFSVEDHDHQSSEIPADDCSPFCSCMCCQLQVHVFKPFPIYTKSIEFDSSEDCSFYPKHYLSQYLEAPFHPPKSMADLRLG